MAPDLAALLDARAVHALSPAGGRAFVIRLDRAGTHLVVPATPGAIPTLAVLERQLRDRAAVADRRAPVGSWLRGVAACARVVETVLRRAWIASPAA